MNKKENNIILNFFNDVGEYIKLHYPVILLVIVGYILFSTINFFNMTLSQTVFSYHIEDFEVGQIADQTIFAPKSIPADEMNPVFIEEGEKIIRKGFPITSEGYAKLQKMAESPYYLDYRSFSNSELFLFMIATLWYLLFVFAPLGRKIKLRELVFQVICFLLVYAAIIFGSKTTYFGDDFAMLVIIPASLMILMDAILYGQLSAVFCSFIVSFVVFDASKFHVVPFLFTLATCLASSTIVRKIEKRMDLILVSLMQAVFNSVVVVILAVIFNEPFTHIGIICGGVALNGFLSGILTLALLTPVELLLNTASVFRLMDLCDTNAPVLKKLYQTANGTYNHSMNVGILAENACREIGANALLAKVGAWYHDVGKMDQSEYFTENQVDGVNPHNKIAPSLSASILRSHVRKSVELANHMHLPSSVVDIIEEHHGNSIMMWFYSKAKELDPNVNSIDYAYPGTPPSSKESGVVMLADTVEAACRSLANPTEERLDKFIQKLLTDKMEHGQLDNCDLTFCDLNKIKLSFVKFLVGFYHNRVKYPNQKDPDEIQKKEEVVENKQDEQDSVLGDKTLNEVKLNG
ncbi:MAG: HDIG domain-containing protein [Spirochaetia bacterium]|nr:HDIG domain-containing protein [Spirochaetia bacterium]